MLARLERADQARVAQKTTLLTRCRDQGGNVPWFCLAMSIRASIACPSARRQDQQYRRSSDRIRPPRYRAWQSVIGCPEKESLDDVSEEDGKKMSGVAKRLWGGKR